VITEVMTKTSQTGHLQTQVSSFKPGRVSGENGDSFVRQLVSVPKVHRTFSFATYVVGFTEAAKAGRVGCPALANDYRLVWLIKVAVSSELSGKVPDSP
jgi:hypothetical protein